MNLVSPLQSFSPPNMQTYVAAKLHNHYPFSNHKSTTKLHPSSPFTCKILFNSFKKIFSRAQSLRTQLQPQSSIFSPDSVSPPKLNPVQKLADAVLDMVEESIVKKLEKRRKLNRMVDPTVQLEGNFAPVQECPVQHGLEVVGTIPSSVEGVYVRNGANPLFAPISGHHFFDGDGMIHSITLKSGNRASYACRFTRTNRLVCEASLGKSVFPKPIGELHGHLGLARLVLFGCRALIGLVNAAHGTGMANASLVYFNDRLLAMSEDDFPYNVRITDDGDLETIERYDFNGQLTDPLIAHPKVDPITGDLYTLSYNVLSMPHLKFFKFDKSGTKSREVAISLQQPTMIHDFTMTDSHVIIPDHQLIFKLSEMIWGGSPVVYNPKKVSRFGILPRDATDESMIQWIDVPDCFCFHMWNAWEEYEINGDKIIVVINSCMSPPGSIFSSGDSPLKSELSEIRLNLTTGKSTRRVIVSGMNLEVGQVNKHELGKKTRFVYLAIADPWPKCSGIAKVDLSTGNVKKFIYGPHKFGGEPCFVPQKEEEEEEEGFLMSFVRDEQRETSQFVILKASTMEQVALVKLPTRVPYGFHGTFVSSQELTLQSIG